MPGSCVTPQPLAEPQPHLQVQAGAGLGGADVAQQLDEALVLQLGAEGEDGVVQVGDKGVGVPAQRVDERKGGKGVRRGWSSCLGEECSAPQPQLLPAPTPPPRKAAARQPAAVLLARRRIDALQACLTQWKTCRVDRQGK